MSWRITKVYTCALCYTQERGRKLRYDRGFDLPYGWSGSLRRRGDCFCEMCSKAIQRAKLAAVANE